MCVLLRETLQYLSMRWRSNIFLVVGVCTAITIAFLFNTNKNRHIFADDTEVTSLVRLKGTENSLRDVYMGRLSNGKFVIVKTLNPYTFNNLDFTNQLFQNEIDYLTRAKGIPGVPNLVKITREGNSISLVMTRIEGSSLPLALASGRISEDEAFKQLNKLFNELEKVGLYQKDVNAMNYILGDDGQLYLIDGDDIWNKNSVPGKKEKTAIETAKETLENAREYVIKKLRIRRSGSMTLDWRKKCQCDVVEEKLPGQRVKIKETMQELEGEARLEALKVGKLKPTTVSRVIDVLGRSAIVSVTIVGESAQFVFIWLDEGVSRSIKVAKTLNGIIDSLVFGTAGAVCPIATGSSLAITGVTEYFFPDLIPTISDEAYSFVFDMCANFLNTVIRHEKNLKNTVERIRILEQGLQDFKKNPDVFSPPYTTEQFFIDQLKQLEGDKKKYTHALERSQSTYLTACPLPEKNEGDYGF